MMTRLSYSDGAISSKRGRVLRVRAAVINFASARTETVQETATQKILLALSICKDGILKQQVRFHLPLPSTRRGGLIIGVVVRPIKYGRH